MKRFLISLIVLMFVTATAFGQWYYGSGEAVNLEDRIKFQPDNTTIQASSGVLYTTDPNGVTVKVDKDLEADFLLNRSFEKSHSGSPALSWTLSGATGTVSTSSPIDGSQLLSLSLSSTLSLSQEITQTQFYPNVVSFSLWVKSSITDIQLCSTLATVEQECVDYDGSDQWKKLQVLVTAPSSGAMGLKLKTLSTTSGTILVDNGEFSSDPLKFKNQEIMTDWESYTPTFTGFGTVSSYDFKWRRDGQDLLISGTFITGTVTATEGRVSLPNSLTSTSSTYTKIAGSVAASYSSTAFFGAQVLIQSSKQYIVFGRRTSAISDYDIADGNAFTNTETISVEARVPIEGWSSSQSQILTANDVVSSETINWQFKSTAITDCGGADAIGTYNTYDKTASSNTQSICATAPATLPSNADGFYMQALSYTQSGACGGTGISRVDICVGKGLKGFSVTGYQSTNRSGNELDIVYSNNSSSSAYGVLNVYNEKTGLLTLNSGFNIHAESTHTFITSKGNATYSNGYLHFAASKNPVISALDAVPRIDYSWENEFSAKIIATAGGCSVESENYDFIDNTTPCTRTGTGTYQVNFKSSFFTQEPSVSGAVETTNRHFDIESISTSSVVLKCREPATATLYDDCSVFSFHVSRQGSDYRSRGDAAAIIAQPTCYVKDVKASGTNGGTFTSGAWQTRDLNTTSGNCSFLSLSSSEITLQSGKYEIEAETPAYRVDYHKARLYNVTDSSVVEYGSAEISSSADNTQNKSKIFATVEITSSKTYKVEHKCTNTIATSGFGLVGLGDGVELFSQVKITKVK